MVRAITPLPRRSTAPRSTPPFRLPSSSRSSTLPSSTRPSRPTSVWASILVRPTRTSAVPSLPHGTGKTVRVAVFAEGEKAREAEAAGADIIGSDELVAQIQKGEINFDAAIATPNMMAKVGRIGKILGPRGLMPNPKLGTVTMDVAKMVSELKAGRVEYRADRYGICHVPLGKKSFSEQQLVENYAALYTEILRVKPSSAKGKYVKSISVSSTMGPGVKVDPAVQRDFLAE